MKRPSASLALVAAFAIVFLFFIQSAGTLVESIYIMDLMNTSMDEKALGLLFFFSPVLLVPFYKKFPRGSLWFAFALAFITRGLLPSLKTAQQVFAAGVDMSGRNRIDHIFVSHSLGVRNPFYILPPESATDHPVHWAEIFWQK